MADVDIYLPENKTELTELLDKQASLKRNLTLAEEEWMDAMEKLDKIETKK